MLDRASATPLHQQLEELVRNKITSGEWVPGTLIPSENELTKLCGISRMTVRGAISRLVQEDLLIRIPGKGTYVADVKFAARSLSRSGIREQLEQMGYEVQTKLLSAQKIPASGKICTHLHLPAGENVFVIRRLRFVKEEPLSIHTSYIPEYLCPSIDKLDLVQEQLCNILSQKYNLNAENIRETLEIIRARKEESALLNIKPSHPLLLLESTFSNATGVVYEFSSVVFRGDKIKLVFDH